MKPALALLIGFSLFATGCTYQRFMKNGKVYTESGMHKDAFGAYQTAFDTRSRAEARVGMQQAAESYLSSRIQKARAALFHGDYAQARDLLDQAWEFDQSVQHLELGSRASLAQLERDLRSAQKQDWYSRAEAAMLDQRYTEAQELLTQYLKRYPDHTEAQYMLLLAEVHPFYNQGIAAMENELYQQAYLAFLEVTRRDAQFKDALQLREECLAKGSFRLACLPLPNPRVDKALQAQLAASVQEHILALDNPFIRLLERENINQVLAEQQQGFSGLFDQSNTAEAGKLEGAEYVLTLEVLELNQWTGGRKNSEHKGWLGENVRSEKVRYTTHYQNRGMDARVRFQILHAETGQVFATRMVPFHTEDAIHYANYSGPSENLYPGNWTWGLIGSRQDVVDVDGYAQLQAMLAGRTSLKSMGGMETEWLQTVTEAVNNELLHFEPARR